MTIRQPPNRISKPGVAFGCALLALLCGPRAGLAQSTIEVSDALVTVIEQVRVPALSEGAVIKLNVSEGTVVQAGQLLAQIDDRQPRLAQARAKSEFENALKEAESQLEIELAKKKYQLAMADLRRVEKARSMLAGSVPDEEYESRRLQVERTELEIDKSKENRQNAIAQAKLYANDYRRAELEMDLTEVVSPIAGVVVSVERHEGEWAKTGETVLEILGTTKLRAEAMIDVSQIRKPLVGRRVVLLAPLPNGKMEKFRGLIRFESPEINPLDNRVSVWAEIANPKGALRPGMRGRMVIDMAGPIAKQTAVSQPTTTRTESAQK
ncbi:MAG: efflux RND transporter periplasmic adaptor subunit [Rubripirellula sp.]